MPLICGVDKTNENAPHNSLLLSNKENPWHATSAESQKALLNQRRCTQSAFPGKSRKTKSYSNTKDQKLPELGWK